MAQAMSRSSMRLNFANVRSWCQLTDDDLGALDATRLEVVHQHPGSVRHVGVPVGVVGVFRVEYERRSAAMML
jgi:hypothetical protein